MAERWLRAGEREASVTSLGIELERYYAQPTEPGAVALTAALGKAARKTVAERKPSPRLSRKSRR